MDKKPNIELRDHFAAAALPQSVLDYGEPSSIASNGQRRDRGSPILPYAAKATGTREEIIARQAYRYADAMLRARETGMEWRETTTPPTQGATTMTDTPAEGYEVFRDHSFGSLWAARPVGERRFYHTRHFETYEDAVRWTHAPDDPATLAREISNL